MQLPPAQCCCATQADSKRVLLPIHLQRFALHTGVQWPNTCAEPPCFWQNASPTSQRCCAKQAESRLATMQIHLSTFSFHTGVQWPNSSAVPHCYWLNAIAPCSALLCKPGSQQAYDTVNTPMNIVSSHRCAGAQHQCSATLLLAECDCTLLSAAVQTRLTAGLCHCKFTCED